MPRFLIYLGVVLILIGISWLCLIKMEFKLLPGDILIKQGKVTIYIPLATCLVVSVILNFILHLLKGR